MMKIVRLFIICFVLSGVWPALGENPKVLFQTNCGDITIELYPEDAPITVDNFLNYVNSGFYDDTIFHRADNNLTYSIIQGGGFFVQGNTIYPKDGNAPIVNESYNGLSNLRGTIAMARTSEPNSATSQFFMNQIDNTLFDKANYSDGYGYCVFGDVIDGMDVVDYIADMNTVYVGGPITQLPYPPLVIIIKAETLACDTSYCVNFYEDSIVDFKDFAILAEFWLVENCCSENLFCFCLDLDFSGGIDFSDLQIMLDNWLVVVGSEPDLSDFDGSGKVDFDDFLRLTSNWLDNSCDIGNNYCNGADLNRDGIVNFVDYSFFANNWLVEMEAD